MCWSSADINGWPAIFRRKIASDVSVIGNANTIRQAVTYFNAPPSELYENNSIDAHAR